MRILYVVQRYGEEVAGGAETHCRHFAEQLAARNHHIEVITSCAIDYQTWADHYGAGSFVHNDVTIHRLPVRHTRDLPRFRDLYGRLAGGPAQALVSRRIEARADAHALSLTGDPATFEAMQGRLSTVNLSDPDPPAWEYVLTASHPSTVERMAAARAYARGAR